MIVNVYLRIWGFCRRCGESAYAKDCDGVRSELRMHADRRRADGGGCPAQLSEISWEPRTQTSLVYEADELTLPRGSVPAADPPT